MHSEKQSLALAACLPFLCFAFFGCGDLTAPSSKQGNAEKKPKTTQDIGEFIAGAGKDVVPNKVQITNPITGPLEALQPLKQQISALGIQHAVDLFQASEGRYPANLDEFMTRIIKENQIRLPSLPEGLAYEYDVANHQLVVVRNEKKNGNQ